jgi:hypothetical protein
MAVALAAAKALFHPVPLLIFSVSVNNDPQSIYKK